MDVKKLGRIPDRSWVLEAETPSSRELAVQAGRSVRGLLFGFPQDLTDRPVLGLRLDELI